MPAKLGALYPDPYVEQKRAAAEYAVQFITSGMRVGLGSGSTAIFVTRRVGELLRTGELRDIAAFAPSKGTLAEAMALGIPLLDDDLPADLDIAIDGADEVDPALNALKGGGGALLREKIVAQASRRFVLVVDERKVSPQLGANWPVVTVEVLPYGWRSQARYLEGLGAAVTLRTDDAGATVRTDNGNWLLDCAFGPIADPGALARRLEARAGLLEHGLFVGLATDLVVAGLAGVRHVRRES